MSRTPDTPPTAQTRAVLEALLASFDEWHYGYDLSRRTHLSSGTLYPMLMRLAERGWLETRWVEPERAGRPPRHMYRLTGEGARHAATLASVERPARGGLQPRGSVA